MAASCNKRRHDGLGESSRQRGLAHYHCVETHPEFRSRGSRQRVGALLNLDELNP